MPILPDRLKAAMIRARIKAPELAKRSGVSRPYIYELCRGTASNPSPDKIATLARHLGTTAQELLGESESSAAPASAYDSAARLREDSPLPEDGPPMDESLDAIPMPGLIFLARLLSMKSFHREFFLREIFAAMERRTPPPTAAAAKPSAKSPRS